MHYEIFNLAPFNLVSIPIAPLTVISGQAVRTIMHSIDELTDPRNREGGRGLGPMRCLKKGSPMSFCLPGCTNQGYARISFPGMTSYGYCATKTDSGYEHEWFFMERPGRPRPPVVRINSFRAWSTWDRDLAASELNPFTLEPCKALSEGALLLYEEPENGLPPLNQIDLAKNISALIDRGVTALVSTHSPFMLEALLRHSDPGEEESSCVLIKDGDARYGSESVFNSFAEAFEVFRDMDAQVLSEGL